MWRLLALTLALAPAAQAETYKWVDERGVVNYSNTPPPAAAKSAQAVAERVSTYETEPAVRNASLRGVSQYELMQHQEWLQRQRLMAEEQLANPAPAPVDYAAPYYYPSSYGGRVYRPIYRPVRHRGSPRVVHHGGSRRF